MMGNVLSVIVGFSSGAVVAAAVFALITAIGLVPRMAQKTNTQTHCKIYEMAIALGGIFGVVAGFANFRLPRFTFEGVVMVLLSLCVGVFYGVFAMSLAEVLDVFPVLTRRGNIKKGVFIFILAIAAGKTVGALLYFLMGGFYDGAAV